MSQQEKQKNLRRRIIRYGLVLLLALAIVAIRLVERIGDDRKPGDRFLIVKVIDGDTVELIGGDRLRLLAVDAPESGEPLHDEATIFLERMALGRTARIEYANKRRDRYGRLLGYLYIDSILINKALVDSGYANVYLFRDNDLNRPEIISLLDAQRSAVNNRVGIWSVVYESERTYINLPGSYRLHRPGCRSIEKSQPSRFIKYTTREEGLLSGLSPCRNCRP